MTGGCGVHAACPVCATPDEHHVLCTVCGWHLHDDPVLGELTAQDLESAEAALRAAGRAWDTRAAALSGRHPEGRRRLAECIRGGPPTGDEAELPGGTGRTGHTIPARHGDLLDDLLDDLHRGRFKELSFVECAPDGLHMIRVTVGEAGIPVQHDAESVTWRSAVPDFDADDDVCRFQLAGGVGTLRLVDRREFDSAVRGWLAARLPAVPDPPVVLLRPLPGWELLRRAAAVVSEACAPRAELQADGAEPAADRHARCPEPAEGAPARRTIADTVRRLVRTLPLPADHTLLLARADRDTGAVRPHSHVLFPAGSRLGPGETATAEVTVHGGVTGRDALYLPVLAGAPAADGTGAPAVTVHQVAVGALEPARLTFVLRGPGEVDLVAPGARTAEGRGAPSAVDVPRLLRDLPWRIVRPPRLELLFTVELSGADHAETEERLTFVRDVVGLLARRDRAGTAIRVGAVGHYDHTDYESTWAKAGTLLRAPVSARPPAELQAALDGWAPARRRQDTVSSLEDALREVAGLPSGHQGAADVRRVVLVVARRPPAPPRQHGVVPACPRGTDWRTVLARLRSDGFRILTRVDPAAGPAPPDAAGGQARRYAAEAWRILGADGAFRPDADPAEDVARSLAPPWRQEGPDCRLAFAAPLM
ncbi:hypothetical protein ACWHA1_18965 [Streptomyces decoyicus]